MQRQIARIGAYRQFKFLGFATGRVEQVVTNADGLTTKGSTLQADFAREIGSCLKVAIEIFETACSVEQHGKIFVFLQPMILSRVTTYAANDLP
jgi:hypothetical protein